jgi:probable rRNA maturation factor
MLVDCLTEDHRWEALGLDRLAETAAVTTLARLGMEPSVYEISLLGCNDARIAELNADFRGKPQPTNVLSWPSDERGARVDGEMPHLPGPGPTGNEELGDIAIAWETCAAEAQAAGRPVADHVAHLLVHGTLHLLGFDHERPRDAALMEGLEVEILGKLGIPDPYSQDHQPDAPATGAPR